MRTIREAQELPTLSLVPTGTDKVKLSRAGQIYSAEVSDLLSGGVAMASGTLLFGTGSSTTRYAMGTTANQQVMGIFAQTTATTGSSRAINARLYFQGVGGEGEALRAYGIVNNVTAATGGTVNGAHITLGIEGASGAVSGAGNALRATLDLGAGTTAGGTLSVIQVDSNINATANIPSTLSFLRFTDTGTGKVPVLMSLVSPDTTNLYINAGTSAGSAGDADNCAAQKVLKILVAGVAAYIPVFTQNS